MDENNIEKQEANPTTPAEKAVVFVNTEVLSPPKADPMTGAAKIMIDQSTGMMVQDLQSFLKGFEQVGLVALSKLAHNFLTYGNYFPPTGGVGAKAEGASAQDPMGGNGNEIMKDLFKIVSDYAEAKTKISGAIFNGSASPAPSMIQNPLPFTDVSAEEEDPEKKND